MNEITVSELQARLAAAEPPLLLDVREDWEYALASLEGAVHIPMNTIPERVHELDQAAEIVVMCKSGGRSLRVAEFLQQNGFSRVTNLNGGIDAWSVEIDAAVRRY